MRTKALSTAVFALCATGFGQDRGVWQLSPVPIWPRSGDISRFPDQQYVFLDPTDGNSEYVVAIRSQDGKAVERTLRAPLHNAVAPEIAATVTKDQDGRFHYHYTLSNGPSARKAIQRWVFAVEQNGHEIELKHPSWKGAHSDAKLPGVSTIYHEVYKWETSADSALEPGQSERGFEVVSDLAPGYVLAAFYGRVSAPELTPEDWTGLPEPAVEPCHRSPVVTALAQGAETGRAEKRGARCIARRTASASGWLEAPVNSGSAAPSHRHESGEALSLTWGQTDLIDETLTVGRAKTSNGTGRMIPINAELGGALTTHRTCCLTQFGEPRADHYLFPWGKTRTLDPTRHATDITWASERYERPLPSA